MHSRQFVTHIALLLTLAVPATGTAAPTVSHHWSKRFGAALGDRAYAVAIDPSGNVFVTGYFSGTVDFGGGGRISAGGTDIFVAKFSPTGTHMWSRSFGSTTNDQGLAIATNVIGHVFVGGSFTGSVNFGGATLISAGGEDIFLARYDPDGGHVWSQSFGSTGLDQCWSVAVDHNIAGVVITGAYTGSVNFGGGALIGAGNTDAFVAKFTTPSGTHQWSQRYGSTGADVGAALAIDASSNIVVTGTFSNTVNFGGAALVSAGGIDGFVAQYNGNNVHQWSKRFGAASSDYGRDVDVDIAGNVFLLANFSISADFGGGALPSLGSWDTAIAKFTAGGTHLWSASYGGSSFDEAMDIAVDTGGNVYATGSFFASANYGGQALVGAGDDDVFVASYDNDGNHRWSAGMGSPLLDNPLGACVGGTGGLIIAGFHGGPINFGGGPLTWVGSDDIFLAKFGANGSEPAIASITDIGNDQGRRVRVAFDRSGHDDPQSTQNIVRYEAFRRADDVAITSPATVPTHELLIAGWEMVAAVSAYGEDEYLMVAPTLADSTVSQGQFHSAFFVRAATASPYTFFDSPVDSGYSLDNLAPSAPANLVFAGNTLTWDESPAADFDYFAVYGSTSSTFNTSAVLIGHTTATQFNLPVVSYPNYFVTATDFSGNEGPAAPLGVATGVDGTPQYALAINAYPNPFNPSTTIRFDIPTSGRVRVSVYDARGARVAQLVDQGYEAGSHTVRWTGRDDRGVAAGSGVYFARLEWNGATQTRKLVLLK